MKEETIIGNNWLIAEFMELNYQDYNIDWRVLMPVVDKIIDTDITHAPNWTGYRIEIVPKGYVKISGFPMLPIYKNVSIEGGLIEATWLAVVEFIKYWNSINKENNK